MNYITPAHYCPDTDDKSDAGWASLKTAVSHMAAVAETQKDQVSHFQETLKELRGSVDRLGQTCEKYLRRLGKIRIRRLRHHSLALVQTMEASVGPRLVGG